MLRKGLRHTPSLARVTEPGPLGGLPHLNGQPAAADRVPGERSGEVAVPVEPGVQGGGVRYLGLHDVVGERGQWKRAGGEGTVAVRGKTGGAGSGP